MSWLPGVTETAQGACTAPQLLLYATRTHPAMQPPERPQSSHTADLNGQVPECIKHDACSKLTLIICKNGKMLKMSHRTHAVVAKAQLTSIVEEDRAFPLMMNRMHADQILGSPEQSILSTSVVSRVASLT